MVQSSRTLSRLPCRLSIISAPSCTFPHRSILAKSFFRHEILSYGYSTPSAMPMPNNLKGRDGPITEFRIHIIGIGNVGRLFAHSINRLPDPPPVTLLLHRHSLTQDFQKAGEAIEILVDGISSKIGGFEYEVTEPSSGKQPESMIQNLIVTTKATHTLSALSAIKHRINNQSTVLFTQNGMGLIDLLNSELFSSPSTRPLYLTSVIFHGIHSNGPFSSIHTGQGFINIAAPSPSPSVASETPVSAANPSQHNDLLSTILAIPTVNAIQVSSTELLLIQLEKLVVNAIINPLTALFRLRNKELYTAPAGPSLAPLISALISETRAVILALPELRDGEGVRKQDVEKRFGMPELRTLVYEKAIMTGKNRSSMLADAEAGRETEVDFINGWVVRKGREVGIVAPVSERVVELVKGGRVVGLGEVEEVFGV